jgi:two-component sensor histidine kinase
MQDAADSRVVGGDGGFDPEALLREIDHRVKNNLQLISSVIQLQSRRTGDPAARQALKAVLQRVSAIAAVHRRIYRADDREVLDLAQMIRDLVADLAAAAGRDGIALQMALDTVIIEAAKGGPLGLLTSELVGNALQHAFPDGRIGVVSVTLRRTAVGFVLAVADNGVGVADPAAVPRGFGLDMAQMLALQLRAKLETVDSQPGLRTTLTVPLSA